MTIFILIPLCVMIFCYSHIYIAIKRQSKSFGDGNLSSSENVRERRMIKAKINIFKTMVCLCYFSCWILNAIVVHLIFCQFPTLEVHSMMSLLTWHFLIAALIHLSTLSNIEIFKMLLRYCLVRMISRKMLQSHCLQLLLMWNKSKTLNIFHCCIGALHQVYDNTICVENA